MIMSEALVKVSPEDMKVERCRTKLVGEEEPSGDGLPSSRVVAGKEDCERCISWGCNSIGGTPISSMDPRSYLGGVVGTFGQNVALNQTGGASLKFQESILA